MENVLSRWRTILDFPLFRAGGVQFTPGHIIELVVLLTVVWISEMLFRRLFLTRVLSRSRLRPSVQFAISLGAKLAIMGKDHLRGVASLKRDSGDVLC